jgi:transposase InsO family protein
MGLRGSRRAKSNLAIRYDQDLGWPDGRLGILGECDRLCTREILSWNLSHRCRTEEALEAVEQAVLARLPEGSRDACVTLTTDNGTQFTSTRFIETLHRLGITHRRTAYNHPEGNSYIERFHRSLKEEEVWTAEYRDVQEARASIARWIEEYNHDRPHRGVGNRTPHEAFLSFAVDLKDEALTV